jgi:sortase A
MAAAFLFLGAAVDAAWIPVKAELAQWLIERSWKSGGRIPPWPWADTRPAAVLEAPAHGVRLLVLEGNSSRNLAFGPVFSDGTAQASDMVINGHRDTHFEFLQQLKPGDLLSVQRSSGEMQYEVTQTDVVDSRERELLIDPGVDRLSLVTCYPFDKASAGGPLRYVVTALPVSRRSASSG